MGQIIILCSPRGSDVITSGEEPEGQRQSFTVSLASYTDPYQEQAIQPENNLCSPYKAHL